MGVNCQFKPKVAHSVPYLLEEWSLKTDLDRGGETSADPEGGTGGPDPPLENPKLYGFI